MKCLTDRLAWCTGALAAICWYLLFVTILKDTRLNGAFGSGWCRHSLCCIGHRVVLRYEKLPGGPGSDIAREPGELLGYECTWLVLYL